MIRNVGARCAPVVAGVALIAQVGCNATRPTHVACIGDSITAGDGASTPATSYPAILQTLLGKQTTVEGFGHSGATVLGPGAGDLPYETQPEYTEATSFVAGAGPNARVAVVILLGANDSKPALWDVPGRSARFGEDYGRLLDHFASLPTHPTLYVATPLGTGAAPCCGIRGDVLVHDITPRVRELAAQHGATVIDLGPVVAGHVDRLVDGVHPNDAGYRALATTIRDTLLQAPPKLQPGGAWWGTLFR